jgi:hypothetical protein
MWVDIGRSLSGSAGAIPLTWNEILSYCTVKGIELSDWESGVIMKLSRSYVAMLSEAREADCPAPYVTEEAQAAIDKAKKERAKLKESIK